MSEDTLGADNESGRCSSLKTGSALLKMEKRNSSVWKWAKRERKRCTCKLWPFFSVVVVVVFKPMNPPGAWCSLMDKGTPPLAGGARFPSLCAEQAGAAPAAGTWQGKILAPWKDLGKSPEWVRVYLGLPGTRPVEQKGLGFEVCCCWWWWWCVCMCLCVCFKLFNSSYHSVLFVPGWTVLDVNLSVLREAGSHAPIFGLPSKY